MKIADTETCSVLGLERAAGTESLTHFELSKVVDTAICSIWRLLSFQPANTATLQFTIYTYSL